MDIKENYLCSTRTSRRKYKRKEIRIGINGKVVGKVSVHQKKNNLCED